MDLFCLDCIESLRINQHPTLATLSVSPKAKFCLHCGYNLPDLRTSEERFTTPRSSPVDQIVNKGYDVAVFLDDAAIDLHSDSDNLESIARDLRSGTNQGTWDYPAEIEHTAHTLSWIADRAIKLAYELRLTNNGLSRYRNPQYWNFKVFEDLPPGNQP